MGMEIYIDLLLDEKKTNVKIITFWRKLKIKFTNYKNVKIFIRVQIILNWIHLI